MSSLYLPDEFKRPLYADLSIANVPSAIAAMLNVPFQGLPPLADRLWRPMADGVKRVVLLIVDGWGWNLLQQERENLSGLLTQTAVCDQLTSIFPSTTVAALSSLWTGLAPAQHGMMGLSMFMPEYGTTAQMLGFSPAFGKYPDALIKAGMQSEKFLHGPGFGEQLTAGGVNSYAFKGRNIVNSALSKMHDRGITEDCGISSVPDMFVQIRQLLEEKSGERLFVSAYWPMVDTLSHIYGWNHPAVAAELRTYISVLQAELIGALSAAARAGTAVFIVADHGQIVTPPAQHIHLADHPRLRDMLFMTPTGEARAAYFYAKHGRQDEIVHYINTELTHAMFAFPSADALQAELFGPAPHASRTAERAGDVTAVMRDGYALITEFESEFGKKFLGRHGGMTAAEMTVPWLGLRLDA